MPRVLEAIEAHRALRHPLFQEMAKHKLSLKYRELFFREMGEFCRASRDFGVLADHLDRWNIKGNAEAAQAVREIAKSEEDHAAEFEAMAKHLTENPEFSATDGERFQATERAAGHFSTRRSESRLLVDASLGALIAVELLTHRHIIPGEITAFVTSGHYGVSLDDPGMQYLKNHAGDLRAESKHEELVLTRVANLETNIFSFGATEFLDDVATWYDILLNCLYDSDSTEPPS
jgi:hypothetical protein